MVARERTLVTTAAALEAVQLKLDRLVERNLEGALDDATFARLQEKLTVERDAALQRLQDTRTAAARALGAPARWQDAREICASYAERLDLLSAPDAFVERQELVRLLVREVRVNADEIRLVGILPMVTRVAPIDIGHEAHRYFQALRRPLGSVPVLWLL